MTLQLGLDRTIFWKHDTGFGVGGGAGYVDARRDDGSVIAMVETATDSKIGAHTNSLKRPSDGGTLSPFFTTLIKGHLKIKNVSREELPSLTVHLSRSEVFTVRQTGDSGRNKSVVHKRTNVIHLRSLRWGPILPNSTFARILEVGVNLAGHPPSIGGHTTHHNFNPHKNGASSYEPGLEIVSDESRRSYQH